MVKFAVAVGIDLVLVLIFARIGRQTHAEGLGPLGVLDTAWPFLLAAIIGTVLARGWRRPLAWSTGLIVWVSTAVGGLLIRMLSGDTAAWEFWIVTLITLAILLLGWRLVGRWIERARTRRAG